jgi:(S)-2-hydroxyglutarate dehydrogenase
MEGHRVDVAVIGGGIVGVATAMALLDLHPGLSLVVLEKEAGLARHQTGHNSGVIHSGLYYRPGSLKAINCVSGREALYRFCREHDIKHEQCGKVVVALNERELTALQELERRGRANGLQGLEFLDEGGLRDYEPHVAGIAGLWVPETGIVDFASVTEGFAKVVRQKGGEIRTNSRVRKIRRRGKVFGLDTPGATFECRAFINCTGLDCDRVARLSGTDPGLRIVPFRGEYYKIAENARYLVRNLIYPVPDPAFPFLGVHFTRMINGDVEAGPNAVLSLKREGYGRLNFSPRDTLDILSYRGFWHLAGSYAGIGFREYRRSLSKREFVRDLRKLIPELKYGDVAPGGAGVRAQAVSPDGKLLDDFRIIEEEGMIHVLNAPSPAATASISIGRAIAELAGRNFGLD